MTANGKGKSAGTPAATSVPAEGDTPAVINRYGRVLCLEGDWDNDLTSRTSVLPTLELLERMRIIDFVHRTVTTKTDLAYYLQRWGEDPPLQDYFVLYLAAHGASLKTGRRTTAILELSDHPDGTVTLKELADMLGDGFENCVVHFGSCSVMRASDSVLDDFRTRTGVKAVTGYRENVAWVPSAAMDQLFLNSIASYHSWAAARKAHEKDTSIRSLKSALGFRIHPATSR